MLLFALNIQSWKAENDRMKEKFLNLLGKIGKDARSPKTTSRVSKINRIWCKQLYIRVLDRWYNTGPDI